MNKIELKNELKVIFLKILVLEPFLPLGRVTNENITAKIRKSYLFSRF